MQNCSSFVLNYFIDKLPSTKKKTFLSFLPDEEVETLETFSLPEKRLDFHSFFHESLIEKVHYSWWIPLFKRFRPRERKLFVAAFSQKRHQGLYEVFDLPPQETPLSKTAKAFLRSFLLQTLLEGHKTLLPIASLPDSPLNLLIDLTKDRLTEIIHYLSLYDLAFELRQILDRKILYQLDLYLTDEEKSFLKSVKKKPFSAQRIGLEKWDGERKSLYHLLQKRGLHHFSIALSGQHPDLIWHISHILDTGRGKMLMKWCKQTASPNISELLISHVLHIVHLFNDGEEKSL